MTTATFYDHTCGCGCGKPIDVRPCHRYSGVPRFAKGHRIRHGSAKTWASAQQGRHVCQCGCGEKIVVLPEHYWRGVPRYLNHHSTRVAMFHTLHSWTANTSTTSHLTWKQRKFSFADKVRILSRCGFRCVRCGEDQLEVLEFDHIVPVAAGGETTPENGQALCRECHGAKSRIDISVALRAASARRNSPAPTPAVASGHDKETGP